jgi:hypothetical protein
MVWMWWEEIKNENRRDEATRRAKTETRRRARINIKRDINKTLPLTLYPSAWGLWGEITTGGREELEGWGTMGN